MIRNAPDHEKRARWTHVGDKFTIGTVDGKQSVEISAQYNPKELGFASTASWAPHVNNNGSQQNAYECHTMLEYGSTESRTLTVELLFDGYEENASVDDMVYALEKLLVPVDPSSMEPHRHSAVLTAGHRARLSKQKAWERRPPLCVAVWGEARPFRCVVLSVQTKITMFSRSGNPLRAVCNVVLKEVDTVRMLAGDKYDQDPSRVDRDAVRRVRSRSSGWDLA